MMQLIETIALVPTSLLLAIMLSQYIILLKRKKIFTGDYSPDISIIVPAHNEGRYLERTIKALLRAEYKGKKEIVVIDDGSSDSTPDIAKRYAKKGLIKTIRTNHVGKSRAMNEGLKIATNGIIVVIDGDTEVERGSLKALVKPLTEEKVAAVGGIVKVKNRNGVISWFQRIEYMYSSFFNSLCDRINGNIFTPGPISAFKKDLVEAEGGFNTKIYLEDVDMALRIIKKGYKVRIAEEAIVRTNVPHTLKTWARQRKRWMRGGIEVIKSHKDILFRRKFGACGFYPLPMITYWYFHSIMMGIIIFLQVFLGYHNYFVVYGNGFSLNALQYFFLWFSFAGIINLVYQMLVSNIAPTALIVMSVLLTLAAYPLYIYPFRRFKEKLGPRDVIALFFLFPYWILILIIQSTSNITWFRSKWNNWWKK